METLNIEDIVALRKQFKIVKNVPIIEIEIDYQHFLRTYLLPNYPCLLSSTFTNNWRSRKEWLTDKGSPDYSYLAYKFGEAVVPVANCKNREYDSHSKKSMTLQDYMTYWESYSQNDYPEDMECLYLKDFHFNREFPDYTAYETPPYFTSDWMNEYWDKKDSDSPDDYRFVYMGPKGSWTPFHADVFRSFSWSANICGKKKWIFFPPGEEDCFKDVHGDLVFDVDSEELNDPSKYPNYRKNVNRIEIIQKAGEIIFVPSGWHHQVHNLEDTISINHNWLNGCNVDISWSYIKQGLHDVEREIIDVREEMLQDKIWFQHCQTMLRADKGINFPDFFEFMRTIALHRISILTTSKTGSTYKGDKPLEWSSDPHLSDHSCVLFDLQRLKFVLEDMLTCTEYVRYDEEIDGNYVLDTRELISQIDASIRNCHGC